MRTSGKFLKAVKEQRKAHATVSQPFTPHTSGVAVDGVARFGWPNLGGVTSHSAGFPRQDVLSNFVSHIAHRLTLHHLFIIITVFFQGHRMRRGTGDMYDFPHGSRVSGIVLTV